MFSKDFTKAFILIISPFAVVLTAGSLLFLAVQYNNSVQIIKKNEYLQLDLATKSIVRDLQNILPDMKILINESYLHDYIKSPDKVNRHRAEQALKRFSQSKRIYKQISFLENSGLEKIRIDYNGTNASIISAIHYRTKANDTILKTVVIQPVASYICRPLTLTLKTTLLKHLIHQQFDFRCRYLIIKKLCMALLS